MGSPAGRGPIGKFVVRALSRLTGSPRHWRLTSRASCVHATAYFPPETLGTGGAGERNGEHTGWRGSLPRIAGSATPSGIDRRNLKIDGRTATRPDPVASGA